MVVQMVNSNLSSLTRSLHCSMDGLNVSLGKNFFFVCITALSSLVNCWYCDCKFYKTPRANIKALSCLCISHPHVNLHPMRKETMSIIFSVRKKFSINIKRMNHTWNSVTLSKQPQNVHSHFPCFWEWHCNIFLF